MKRKKLILMLVMVLFVGAVFAQINVTITNLIADLNSNGAGSQYNNASVRISGFVTIGANRIIATQLQAYVQDRAGYGIQVYAGGAPNATLVQTFTRGNLVDVIGTVSIQIGSYAGGYRITHTSSSVVEDGNPDSFVYAFIPEGLTRELTLAQAGDYARNNGTFGRVAGTVYEQYANTGGVNLNIEEGTTRLQVRVWDTAGISVSSFPVGTRVYVYGVVYVYNNSAQLLPGYPTDILVNTDPPPPPPPSEFDKLHGTLQIVPKAYNIYENDKVEIRYTAKAGAKVVIRIYNSEGKLMATPENRVAAGNMTPIFWNGRDDDYRLVEPGLYICSLEVHDRNTGKKEAYTAPIVVGMRLK